MERAALTRGARSEQCPAMEAHGYRWAPMVHHGVVGCTVGVVQVRPRCYAGCVGGVPMLLTLKVSAPVAAELMALVGEREGATRHAVALEALALGLASLRGLPDPRSPDALAELVAEKVARRLAWDLSREPGRDESPTSSRDESPAPATPATPARKGTPGAVPRRPGDHKAGGKRKTDPPEESAGALFLEWRKREGLSQSDAAARFGVARKTWGRWETGERMPDAATVERVRNR